ncbi:MAG: hypothetical protein WD795_13135 [Woeseia sp.]
MPKLLTRCGLLVFLSFLAGCATTTPGLGDQAGNTTLPSGLTLLDSDESECDGTVQVGDEMIEDDGEGLDAELFVEPGENATFELEEDYDEIEWACVGGDSPDVDSMRCPRGSSHVRITRATTGGELLFECYG